MCQAESTEDVVNVKDMFLSGNSTTPMFDSSVVSKNYVCLFLNVCILFLPGLVV